MKTIRIDHDDCIDTYTILSRYREGKVERKAERSKLPKIEVQKWGKLPEIRKNIAFQERVIVMNAPGESTTYEGLETGIRTRSNRDKREELCT